MRKIIITKHAAEKLERLLVFLEEKWSLKVKNDFIEKLDESLSQICKYPRSSPQSKEQRDLYKLVLTKQTSFIYRFDDKRIIIIAIIDNRMKNS